MGRAAAWHGQLRGRFDLGRPFRAAGDHISYPAHESRRRHDDRSDSVSAAPGAQAADTSILTVAGSTPARFLSRGR